MVGPSNASSMPEMITDSSWEIDKLQFDIVCVFSMKILLGNLLETAVEWWGHLGTHGEKWPKHGMEVLQCQS